IFLKTSFLAVDIKMLLSGFNLILILARKEHLFSLKHRFNYSPFYFNKNHYISSGYGLSIIKGIINKYDGYMAYNLAIFLLN
ncbi:hypothetical protein ACR77J_11015, partial [Tissierella praeacuta]|uniref:hypothetical protein n=1 Tax=Tissierella praeacuta TaxID=43131 RepID=UPI003DA51EE9